MLRPSGEEEDKRKKTKDFLKGDLIIYKNLKEKIEEKEKT